MSHSVNIISTGNKICGQHIFEEKRSRASTENSFWQSSTSSGLLSYLWLDSFRAFAWFYRVRLSLPREVANSIWTKQVPQWLNKTCGSSFSLRRRTPRPLLLCTHTRIIKSGSGSQSQKNKFDEDRYCPNIYIHTTAEGNSIRLKDKKSPFFSNIKCSRPKAGSILFRSLPPRGDFCPRRFLTRLIHNGSGAGACLRPKEQSSTYAKSSA